MAFSSTFIIFFLAVAQYPQSSALFRLLCITGHICRKVIPVTYEHLLQWQQNRYKATMWLLYKIPALQGCPRCCYYTEGLMLHDSNPESLQITQALQETSLCALDFCGYLKFWAIVLPELHGYSMPPTTFMVNSYSLFHRPALIFQPTVKPSGSYIQSYQCLNHISQAGKKCSYLVLTYNQGLWWGLGGAEGTFWLHKETLTFKGPAA